VRRPNPNEFILGHHFGPNILLAMKSIAPLILFTMFVTGGALASASRVPETLLASARKALPQDIRTNEMIRVLEAGLWNSNRTAVAVSFSRPKASVIFVFLQQTNGTYLPVDASGVEGGNLGVLGSHGRKDYDRFETTPVEWLYREDGRFQVVMRTRVWRAARRYTVSEPLLISRSGTVLWR
jgi:hypothetical protein